MFLIFGCFVIFGSVLSESVAEKELLCHFGTPHPDKLPCDRDPSICGYLGVCDSKSKICCSGFPSKCLLHSDLMTTRPLVKCKDDTDCGINGLCDLLLGVCCTSIHTRRLMCPFGLTLWKLEPKCEQKKYCRKDAICYNGHCCPAHRTRDFTHVLKLTMWPYPLTTGCDPNKTPERENTFCSIRANKVTIMGLKARRTGKLAKKTGKLCRINSDCGEHQVCVLKRDTAVCYENPLLDQNFPVEFYPVLSILLSSIPIVIFLLIIFCRSSFGNKHKKIDYKRVYDKKKRITLSDGYARFYV